MTMQTCVGCGAFLMPDWDTCKICGHDPAAPAPVMATADTKKGRRGRRDKAPKAQPGAQPAAQPAPQPAPQPAAQPAAAALPPRPLEEPPETLYAPPEFEETAFDPPLAVPARPEPPPPAPPPPTPHEAPAPTISLPPAAPDLEPVAVRRAPDDDDDDGYDEFEPNRVPIILLVLLIVLLVGYFGIYLPTRDDGDGSPLRDVPGQDDAGTTTSVAVALAEEESHGITVEL